MTQITGPLSTNKRDYITKRNDNNTDVLDFRWLKRNGYRMVVQRLAVRCHHIPSCAILPSTDKKLYCREIAVGDVQVSQLAAREPQWTGRSCVK
jgi:hypothetical protein